MVSASGAWWAAGQGMGGCQCVLGGRWYSLRTQAQVRPMDAHSWLAAEAA